MGILRILLAVAVISAHTGPLFGARFFGGAIAVECFFVISGFYMSLVLSSKYKFLSDFYYNRAIRVFPLYLATLGTYLITASVYKAASGHWLGALSYLEQPSAESITALQVAAAIAANIVILGSDWLHFIPLTADRQLSDLLVIPVVWSLGVELGFYLLAPLLHRLSSGALAAVASVIVVLRGIVSWQAGGWSEWLYFCGPANLSFFLVGMLAHRYHMSRVKDQPYSKTLVCFLTLMWVGLATLYSNMGLTYRDKWLVEIPFVALIPYIFEMTKASLRDQAIGMLSYPLYLIHCLVLAMYAPLRHFVPSDWQPVTILLLSLLGAVPAIRFDNWIDRRLKRTPRRSLIEPRLDSTGAACCPASQEEVNVIPAASAIGRK